MNLTLFNRSTRFCLLSSLAFCSILTNTYSSTRSYLVAEPLTRTGIPGNGYEYDQATVSAFVDPEKTQWVAWNYRTPLPSATHSSRPGEVFFGDIGFGTDDFIRMTITTPSSATMTLDIDQNSQFGTSFGPQNVIFGLASETPDSMRQTQVNSSNPLFFDESGAFNTLFVDAGEYTFHFSFRNMYSNIAGHPWNVYLTVSEIPEPSSLWTLVAGSGALLFVHIRQRLAA